MVSLGLSLPDGADAGMFEDLDADSALVLRKGVGTKWFMAGDIFPQSGSADAA